MVSVLFQLFGGDGWSWIIWIVFMGFMIFFYPRLMLNQIVWKLERTAQDLENMTDDSKRFIGKEISSRPKKSTLESIERFLEFFVIEPVSMDPYGIVKKMEHIVQEQKKRFKYFVNQIAPDEDEEKKASLRMGLAGGIGLNQIAKIVRHYVELIKKTSSLQLAMVLQMQMPLIERMAKAMYKGTKAMTKGQPIGDTLGPYIVANLIGNEKTEEIEEDVMMAKKKMNGKQVYLLKAKGPGGRLGRPGKAVEKLVKKYKISKIITIDASAKLEGEETGSVAEGVGVAMGGPGVEKSFIEEVAVDKDIPLDSIIVKMSQEEAIMPMKKKIKDAFPKVKECIDRSLESAEKGKIIIAGVGNTSGVGNDEKSAEEAEKWIEKHHKKLKKEKEKKKKRSFFGR